MIREDAIPMIKIGEDNEPILRILEETTGLDTGPIRKALKDFEGGVERERGFREKGLIKTLKERGISGSAVIPNIEADPEWVQVVSEMRDEFQKKLGSYRENLK
jgi:hypothetical protein